MCSVVSIPHPVPVAGKARKRQEKGEEEKGKQTGEVVLCLGVLNKYWWFCRGKKGGEKLQRFAG